MRLLIAAMPVPSSAAAEAVSLHSKHSAQTARAAHCCASTSLDEGNPGRPATRPRKLSGVYRQINECEAPIPIGFAHWSR